MNEQNHIVGKQKRRNSFLRSLPKAIQIFQILQHEMKSIYPFQMITKTHKHMGFQQEPYKSSLQKSSFFEKFKPNLETIQMYFQKKNLIYDKFNNNSDEELFNENIFSIEKLKNLKNVDFMTNVQFTQSFHINQQGLLSFDSRFQSGNLSMVSYVQGIYYLLLQNDVNTSGYTSWFYYCVKNKLKGKYRFAILNYGKAGWMHNQGVKICVYNNKCGWRRGCENISCESNKNLFIKGKFLKFNTLYFQYEFEEDNSEIYFSYNVPYTYNDLCCFLDAIESKNYPHFNRKLAGTSIAGNRLQLLTITNFKKLSQGIDLPVIVLMARAHPGETVSSWIMHEFVTFIISDSEESKNLRNNLIFKIFPMINPDGVIHGNYRCSLVGRDLNRRWNQTNKQLFPQVYFIRNQIIDISKRRPIKMILDLHGHTQKKKVFAYGCNDRAEPHRCRLFPYIVSKLTSFFEFRFCNFFMDKSKRGTARISLYNELRIPYTYTIQTSQFGTTEGHLSKRVFSQVTQSLAKSFTILFRTKNNRQQLNTLNNEAQQYENQLINDPSLIKVGADKDSGSDSEPSVDNIKFDRLVKLNHRKTMKIESKSLNFSEQLRNNKMETSLGFQKITKRQLKPRPLTSDIRNKKPIIFIQQPKKLNIEQKRKSNLDSRLSVNRRQMSERIKIPQNQQFASRSQPPIAKRKTQFVSYINLSLSIYDDSKSSKSYRIGSAINHKGRGYNQQLFNKLNIMPSTHSQFRRIK